MGASSVCPLHDQASVRSNILAIQHLRDPASVRSSILAIQLLHDQA